MSTINRCIYRFGVVLLLKIGRKLLTRHALATKRKVALSAAPAKELGAYVRTCRTRKGLTQVEVAERAQMRGIQVSLLETGSNVEVQFYERIARVLGFRNALEMFASGGDDQTRRLLRLWRALPDDEARTDVLKLIQQMIVAEQG